MAKYHLNWRGEAGRCKAQSNNCPFGDAADHFDSPESARAAYEGAQASFATPVTKTSIDLGTSLDHELEARKTEIFKQATMDERDHLEIAVIVGEQTARRNQGPITIADSDTVNTKPVVGGWETIHVPDVENSSIIVAPQPQGPEDGYMGGSSFRGGKVESAYLPAKEAAKLVRADIKAAIKAGELPNDLSYSVQMNSSRSGLQVYIGGKDSRGKASILTDWEQTDPRMKRVKTYLNALGNQFGTNSSNSMYDYFNSHNQATVYFRDKWT